MSSLRVAVFGCGRMGTLRAHAARKWGANVSAVFDTDAKRAQELGNAVSCRVATSPDAVDWKDFDAVFVCTPPYEREPAHLALVHGLPTFIEKPVGLSAAAVAHLTEVAGRTAVLTAVGYMNRYRDSVRLARERLRRHTVLGVSANWVDGVYRVPWWVRSDQSGGPLNEQATHFVDLVRFLVGEPTSVHAVAVPHPGLPAIVGTATITISLSNDVLASLFYSCRGEAKAIGFRVFTTSEEIVLKGWNLDLIDPQTDRLLSAAVTERYAIFDTETAAFLNAVDTGNVSGILCTLHDSLLTQRVLDAASRSLAEGRPQQVDS